FVVGYFVHDASGARVTAGDLLTDEREQSVAAAAQLAWAQWKPANRAPTPAAAAENIDRMLTPSAEEARKVDLLLRQSMDAKSKDKGGKAPVDDDLLEPYSKQETVLRKLYRAQSKRRAAPSKVDAANDVSKGGDDPLSGMDDL
ncbi:MAG TPA: hypothetical protein VK509_04550, partial [Polyangiales bacterium]|nr:hypothetical protein [Polyangiales bacterium]